MQTDKSGVSFRAVGEVKRVQPRMRNKLGWFVLFNSLATHLPTDYPAKSLWPNAPGCFEEGVCPCETNFNPPENRNYSKLKFTEYLMEISNIWQLMISTDRL